MIKLLRAVVPFLGVFTGLAVSVLSSAATSETVISLDKTLFHKSMDEVRSRAEIIVDVVMRSTDDQEYAIEYSDPFPAEGVTGEQYRKALERYKKAIPHIVSSSRELTDSNERRSIAGAFVLQSVEVTFVLKGKVEQGSMLRVRQPGSPRRGIVARGMPMMVPGREYRLYLNRESYIKGSFHYSIVGLNAGVLRKHGDEVYHEETNTTRVQGRLSRGPVSPTTR